MRSSALIFIIALLLPVSLWACSEPLGGYKDPTIPEYADKANTLLIGKVVKLIPDPKFAYGNAAPPPEPSDDEEGKVSIEVKSKVFTAVINVDCIFKGSKTINKSISISHIGEIPGHCIATSVDVGKEYIFALSELAGRFTLWSDKIEKTAENVAKLTKQCGLFSTQPINTPEDEKTACPAVADPDTCEPYVPPPPVIEPEPPILTPEIKPADDKAIEKDKVIEKEEVKPMDKKPNVEASPVAGGDINSAVTDFPSAVLTSVCSLLLVILAQ